MKSWFLKREYSEKLNENKIRKVKLCERVKCIPFAVTYLPQLKNLEIIINQKFYLLDMNEKTKKVFSPRPMISFRSPRKVSGYLVKAKLHRLDRILGSTRCG